MVVITATSDRTLTPEASDRTSEKPSCSVRNVASI
jgi:hypothetical protein